MIDPQSFTLGLILRDEKKDCFTILTKNASIIKKLLKKSVHPPLSDKTTAKI